MSDNSIPKKHLLEPLTNSPIGADSHETQSPLFQIYAEGTNLRVAVDHSRVLDFLKILTEKKNFQAVSQDLFEIVLPNEAEKISSVDEEKAILSNQTGEEIVSAEAANENSSFEKHQSVLMKTLKGELGEQRFDFWFSDADVTIDEAKLILWVKNKFVADWIKKNLRSEIASSIEKVLGKGYSWEVRVKASTGIATSGIASTVRTDHATHHDPEIQPLPISRPIKAETNYVDFISDSHADETPYNDSIALQDRKDAHTEIKFYVLEKIRTQTSQAHPFVRIKTQEIAKKVGLTVQAVNGHIRNLLIEKAFHRERRFYFSETPSQRFPSLSEKQLDSNESGFPNVFEKASEIFSETKNDTKVKYQEKINKINKGDNVENLGKHVDFEAMEFKQLEHRTTKLFNRYSAGIRQGTSATLIHRFVAGLILRIPLITFEELEEQLKQAEKETNLYKAFQGIGKRPGVYKPYVHISNYLKKCFEAAGWVWAPCSPPFDSRLKNEHRKKARNQTPMFPRIEDELKRRTYPKSSPEQNRSTAQENLPSILIDGIGKLPPPLSAGPPDGMPSESLNKEHNHPPNNSK